MTRGQSAADAADPDFETLLEQLKRQRGFDFTSYKRAGLLRRTRKRMDAVGVAGFAAYRDYLDRHPEELARLFNAILINVTDFFRDPQSWRTLGERILPRILAGRGRDEPIRVWSAGCSTGAEPYSLAILLTETLGEARFGEQVTIYATDIDEEALAYARQGSYTAREIEKLAAPLRERYFVVAAGRFLVRPELRRRANFGRHDLVQDAPISRVDLLVCRNTLMYFTAEAQTRILARLHAALRDDGFLFLGRAEMLLTRGHLFLPADLKARIFAKAPGLALQHSFGPAGRSGATGESSA